MAEIVHNAVNAIVLYLAPSLHAVLVYTSIIILCYASTVFELSLCRHSHWSSRSSAVLKSPQSGPSDNDNALDRHVALLCTRNAPTTPVCPDVPTSSTRPAYLSPQSRRLETLHQGSRTPISYQPKSHHHVSPHNPRSNSGPVCSTYLVKIKHQIQLTNVTKKRIQHLNKEMYRLEVRELVIVGIDACAEE